MNHTELHRNNFIEHGFNIKIDTAHGCGHVINYGYIHEVKAYVNVKYAKTGIIFSNVITALNNEKDDKLVFCNDKSNTVLTIGGTTLNLKFYTKDKVIEILKKNGIEIVGECC